MKAKLIKTEVNYILEDDKGVVIASTSLKKEGLSLSLKNCQAIERGYDLDELAEKYIGYSKDNFDLMDDKEFNSFKAGFQKAVEILGDKKFTLEDMMNCWNKVLTFQTHKETLGEHIQSLQQTEWDVEIVTFTEDDLKSVSEDWGKIGRPKLDVDGCLILKKL